MQVKILVRNDMDKQLEAKAEVELMNISSRVLQAGKVLGIWWGGAVVCVLIPVLHFVLVPMGLLLGLVMSYRQFRFEQFFRGGDLLCPNCKTQLLLKARAFSWPLRATCPHCHAELLVRSR
jgi:hypothetical protein